ncbi:MAG TPA: hemolysin III family protein [Bacteroidales bacterium]|nr:hemolysin III family protein [Bacteroidales bacterium]HPT53213.1 hemolysin III family protein [Bacteroidales bacterium]
MKQEKFYTPREEKANYLSHALGFVMAVVAIILLEMKAVAVDNVRAIVAFAVFGFGMLLCMGSSTLYHYAHNPKLKGILRHFDHGNIYVLIAASFSPVCLILLQNSVWGISLFSFVWLFAAVGIALNFRKLKANNNLKTASFVVMGLCIFIPMKTLIEITTALNCVSVLVWIALGGVFYIAGAVIYAKAKHEFVHAVFHIFVLFGLLCHIISAFSIPL